jgi:hypothetical protein
MSEGWDNHEPAPMEYFHARLMDGFHAFRRKKTNEFFVAMDGSDFNRIVVEAKNSTYKKYPKQVNDKAIPKHEI